MERPDDLHLFERTTFGVEIPEPNGGARRPAVAERADHVEAERVGGSEESHERRDHRLTTAPHQQLQRLALNRLLPICEGTEEDHVRSRTLNLRGRPKRGHPDHRIVGVDELENAGVQRRDLAPGQDTEGVDLGRIVDAFVET